MDHGFFGMAFDFDHDGHLNTFERAADFSMFMGIMEENANNNFRDNDFYPDNNDL